MKIRYTGELSLFTCPTVLVTVRSFNDNVLTVSWAGIASSHPEYVTIAINKKRMSHDLIMDARCFCINIPNKDMIREVDYCGNVSGRDFDKFLECGFVKEYYKSNYILINQCSMHLICDVEKVIPLGSHDLFIARVTEKLIDASVADVHKDINPIVYFRPYYFELNQKSLGSFGWSQIEKSIETKEK